MSKIREEADEILAWECRAEWAWVTSPLHKQAERILLLEKAYRYQRAAYKLELEALYRCKQSQVAMSDRCWKRGQQYSQKAKQFYKQAEEL